MSARTITRAEYDTKRHHGYAGPACELLDSTRVHITSPFWMLSLEPGHGTCLVGVDLLGESDGHGPGCDGPLNCTCGEVG